MIVSRRDAVLGALCGATAIGAWARLPRTDVMALPSGKLDDVVPMRAGAWSTVPQQDFVLPPEDERKAAAVYEQQLMRSYVAGDGAPVMLLMAYDRRQSGMLQVHRPESCYPGSGFTIRAQAEAVVPITGRLSIPARFLSTQREERFEQVLYWTRIGDRFPQSWDDQRWSIAAQNLRGIQPDGILVRLSVIDPDVDAARERMAQFAAALFAASAPPGRALLVGPTSA